MSRSDDQAFGNPAKLGGVADELSIEKHSGAVGIDRHLDLGGDGGHDIAHVFHHADRDELLFARSQNDLAREVHVAVLTDRELVRAGK